MASDAPMRRPAMSEVSIRLGNRASSAAASALQMLSQPALYAVSGSELSDPGVGHQSGAMRLADRIFPLPRGPVCSSMAIVAQLEQALCHGHGSAKASD